MREAGVVTAHTCYMHMHMHMHMHVLDCRREAERQKRCGEAQLQLCLGRVLQLEPPRRAVPEGRALSPTSPPRGGRATRFGRSISRDALSRVLSSCDYAGDDDEL